MKVMHVKEQDGNIFINEDEFESLKKELSLGESEDKLQEKDELDNAYHNYILNTKTPEQIIKREWEGYEHKLKQLFGGTEVGAYHLPEGTSESQIESLLERLELSCSNRSYVPFIDKEGEQYLVEKITGIPINVYVLSLFYEKYIQKRVLKILNNKKISYNEYIRFLYKPDNNNKKMIKCLDELSRKVGVDKILEDAKNFFSEEDYEFFTSNSLLSINDLIKKYNDFVDISNQEIEMLNTVSDVFEQEKPERYEFSDSENEDEDVYTSDTDGEQSGDKSEEQNEETQDS